MGTKFFGVDIQTLIANSMTSADLPKIILVKKVYGGRTANLTDGITNTSVQYRTRGVVSKTSIGTIADAEQGSITEREVVMIAKPLLDKGVSPAINDQIIAEGRTFTIMSVPDRDPASATFTVSCKE